MDAKIGIIGGTGIADPKLFKIVDTADMDTPFGKPSDRINIAEFQGVKVAFLPRHGSAHTIPPHMVNYRANMYALNEIGVERVIGLAAVGSLKEEFKPGDIIVPDQFIDMTKQRKHTFYDGKKVIHVSMADPFCPELRELAVNKSRDAGVPAHDQGNYVCVEGPRFSTKAESRLWKAFGASLVGMTLVPEVQLARELEMCYVSLASVTDYDVWAEKPVSAKDVLGTMKQNTKKLQDILKVLVPAIPVKRSCKCGEALKDAGL